MANLTNIARPYALAAFECAQEKGDLPAWKAFLAAGTVVAKTPSVVTLLANPKVHGSQLLELFAGVLGSQLDAERKNFLQLLAQNKRFMVLPEIADAFNAYCAQLEKITNVRVITAVGVEESYLDKLTKALTKRIHRDVTLKCEVDPAIIGGAIIHMGDNVIDGSIRGKLTRLLEFSLR